MKYVLVSLCANLPDLNYYQYARDHDQEGTADRLRLTYLAEQTGDRSLRRVHVD